ncbi:hypothetical protein DFJ58DRAFT_749696 [Suillus subalutaceus]|uniref:uncharacterized protein n=1 Tax=Suillus subalutaceus TaxID=48586 RepID=UPI001B861E8F|nr:uncharacterized protein DFJ58DRAFT_749696 [Suillus subalutaceus]KAG1836764.1 hypothetical protein DFJ58DRAFT_749696 [Suillus subalutaceus]
MYNRDQDTIIISARSYDKGWDFLKALMEGDPYAPYGRIESQPLDLPDDWKLPSQPFARFCSTQLYLITLGKPDLEELWRDVSQWNGVNKRVICSGPDLFIASSLLIPILSSKTNTSTFYVDVPHRPRGENYEALMNLSASFLLVYVLCQWLSPHVRLLYGISTVCDIPEPGQDGGLDLSRSLSHGRVFTRFIFGISGEGWFYIVYRGGLLDVFCGGLYIRPSFGRCLEEECADSDLARCIGFLSVVWRRLGLLTNKL